MRPEVSLPDDEAGRPVQAFENVLPGDRHIVVLEDGDVPLRDHMTTIVRRATPADLQIIIGDWASRRAGKVGARWQRLDAWASNGELHQYYRSRGWTHIRTVNLPHRGSGALFQRPAGTQTGRGPTVVEASEPVFSLASAQRIHGVAHSAQRVSRTPAGQPSGVAPAARDLRAHIKAFVSWPTTGPAR